MHGIAYLRGKSVRSILGELCGRSSGSSRGKGGYMHFYSKDNLYGGFGIVGSQVPIATGVAFAMKYREDNHISYPDANDERRIAIGMYGDGAANQGQIYESFNMAKLWNLPMLFLCENNLYGMGTSVERASADVRFYMRCHYIPGLRVNGQDLVSVLCGTRFAADYVRSGQGPFLLEYYTYRFLGHSMSDPGLSYRTRDEIKEMRKTNDPIELFAEKVLGANLCSDEEIDGIKREVEEEVDL
ncbi:MAG: Pyruvate dehydrogenase E1 component subunit alpha, somatic form, mitochondrial, partial [Marteilia pararefringens]